LPQIRLLLEEQTAHSFLSEFVFKLRNIFDGFSIAWLRKRKGQQTNRDPSDLKIVEARQEAFLEWLPLHDIDEQRLGRSVLRLRQPIFIFAYCNIS
jgi:hypothetical protein